MIRDRKAGSERKQRVNFGFIGRVWEDGQFLKTLPIVKQHQSKLNTSQLYGLKCYCGKFYVMYILAQFFKNPTFDILFVFLDYLSSVSVANY